MVAPPVHYPSPDEDNRRWLDFEHRDGDIVISTRSKHGTTWMQMICALLVFQRPDLPAPLAELSPWLDWRVTPRDQVFEVLDRQTHRRIIKTHTPLDGLPLDPRVTYIVVGRRPLDAAVSLYHQRANIDRARLAELIGAEAPVDGGKRPTVDRWLSEWVIAQPDPRTALDSLPGVMHHLADAWGRRATVELVHYDDLLTDLPAQMNKLADRLELPMSPDLVQPATFAAMRARSDELAPDPARVLIDRHRFFRAGRSGTGRAALDPRHLAIYEQHTTAAAPPDLLTWLHQPRSEVDTPR
ncbi:MAG: sulfotransferase domain-containing protein [Acidimicrobiales bacterium]